MIPREWIRPTERELTPAQIKMLPDGAKVTMIGSDRHGECYREELVVVHSGKRKYLRTMALYYGDRRLIDIKSYPNRRFTVGKESK